MQAADVYLLPGDFYFGGPNVRIRTILGSCVAIALWHPKRKIGGMCHYMLPQPSERSKTKLDGRYAEDAFELFAMALRKSRTEFMQYHAHMIGAGNMFPSILSNSQGLMGVGQRNISAGLKFLAQYDLEVKLDHLGGIGHRSLAFDVAKGILSVKHGGVVSTIDFRIK